MPLIISSNFPTKNAVQSIRKNFFFVHQNIRKKPAETEKRIISSGNDHVNGSVIRQCCTLPLYLFQKRAHYLYLDRRCSASSFSARRLQIIGDGARQLLLKKRPTLFLYCGNLVIWHSRRAFLEVYNKIAGSSRLLTPIKMCARPSKILRRIVNRRTFQPYRVRHSVNETISLPRRTRRERIVCD